MSITVSAAHLMGQEEHRQPQGTLPGQGQTSLAKPDEMKPIASFKNGRLTVRAERRSLKAILNEISQEAKVAIISAPGVGAQQVSAHFQELPLDEGVRQILKDYDVFFFYGADKQGPASLKAVWVYARGQGRGIRPVPPDQWASTKEIEDMLRDPDPVVRARAYSSLIERKRGQALQDVLFDALNDQDDGVRTLALNTALHKGVKPPEDSLINLALNDASPHVRFLALNALSNDPQVRAIAERALTDPDVHVQSRAQEILDDARRSNDPQKSGTQPAHVRPEP